MNFNRLESQLKSFRFQIKLNWWIEWKKELRSFMGKYYFFLCKPSWYCAIYLFHPPTKAEFKHKHYSLRRNPEGVNFKEVYWRFLTAAPFESRSMLKRPLMYPTSTWRMLIAALTSLFQSVYWKILINKVAFLLPFILILYPTYQFTSSNWTYTAVFQWPDEFMIS